MPDSTVWTILKERKIIKAIIKVLILSILLVLLVIYENMFILACILGFITYDFQKWIRHQITKRRKP